MGLLAITRSPCALDLRWRGNSRQKHQGPQGELARRPYGLKLSFDRRLVDSRPYLCNFFAAKFVNHILGKGNSLAVYVEAEERSLWRTVEAQPARYIRRIGNQHLDVETKVRNFIKVSLQHFEITR
jgi:hypothetical protein